MFKGDKKIKKGVKNVDKLVTWMIIGWVVASLFWVATKTNKWKEITKECSDFSKKQAKKWISIFGKVLAKTVSLLSKKK